MDRILDMAARGAAPAEPAAPALPNWSPAIAPVASGGECDSGATSDCVAPPPRYCRLPAAAPDCWVLRENADDEVRAVGDVAGQRVCELNGVPIDLSGEGSRGGTSCGTAIASPSWPAAGIACRAVARANQRPDADCVEQASSALLLPPSYGARSGRPTKAGPPTAVLAAYCAQRVPPARCPPPACPAAHELWCHRRTVRTHRTPAGRRLCAISGVGRPRLPRHQPLL